MRLVHATRMIDRYENRMSVDGNVARGFGMDLVRRACPHRSVSA